MFLGIYDYTVYLTYLNLLIGFLGIFLIIDNYDLKYPFVCLLLSGICDMFDGIISNFKKERTLKERIYGIQIDSLADIISFGILPILIGCNLYNKNYNNNFIPKILFFIIVSLYILTILIRLAYFNVMAERHLNPEKTKNKDFNNEKIFIGVPVTISSFVFPFLFLLQEIFKLEPNIFINIYLFFISFLSFLFVFDKIKCKKPKNVGIILLLFLFFLLLILYFNN